eukprot:11567509-Alexandrium_andersonii.AAC.1
MDAAGDGLFDGDDPLGEPGVRVGRGRGAPPLAAGRGGRALWGAGGLQNSGGAGRGAGVPGPLPPPQIGP